MIRLEVAVAAPLKQTLSYLFSSEDFPFPESTIIGKRVLVPLGRRRVTGYVLGVLPDEDTEYTLKPILGILDNSPLFHSNLAPFFRWIARYYHFPIGEVIKAALPGGLTPGSEKIVVATRLGREQVPGWSFYDFSQPPWWSELQAKGSLSTAASKKIFADKEQRRIFSSLKKLGYTDISEKFRKDRVREKEEICYSLSPSLQFPSEISCLDPENCNALRLHLQEGIAINLKKSEVKTLCFLAIIGNVSGNARVPQKDLLKRYPGAVGAIPGLIAKELITKTVTRVFRSPFGGQLAYFSRPETLTEEQRCVLEKIRQALQTQKFQPFLLHGVTGSGKTEVYLRAAEKTLELGKDVLVLVPEIALATQLESHFVSRFGDQVVLLHSGLSMGERYDQWSLAASGQARIVIGARSALFAPLENPGLIVVDEEHDQGYKQDDSLRYQGRDLAVLRARYHDAVVLLGSATPSVTSYYHAMTGKYTLLKMTRRVADRPLPAVTIIDLRKKAETEAKGILRTELRKALADNLARQEQSMLLLNRRGFSANVICQECGAPVECIHCHVALVFHKKQQRLVCHYCGYNLPHRLICAKCGSQTLVPVGFGTERVEEEVAVLFPNARIARLDSDTAADRKKFLLVLKGMYDREIDILIGTQMIAKGHHFPSVTLVGAVWADGGLNMPDFRAGERTFQLISQVTGRAGRGETPGRVIVQTMQPDHYSIVYARNHQYEALYEHEIKIRRMPLFPPFVRLIAFLIHGEVESNVRETAGKVAALCREIKKGAGESGSRGERLSLEVMGPAPAPLDRLCDRYRWQVLLKGNQLDELHGICSAVLAKAAHLTAGDTRISVDVDPENMM